MFYFSRRRRTRFGNDECSICLNCLNPETTTTTVCNHKFCKGCIDRWNETRGRNATCPNCRTRLNPVQPTTRRRYSPYQAEAVGQAPATSASSLNVGDEEEGLDGNMWIVQAPNGRRRWVPQIRVINNIAPRQLFDFGSTSTKRKRKSTINLTFAQIKKIEYYLKSI
jgi:hypothetical protein